MAYAAKHNSADRTKITVAVVILEAAAIYGVIAGLSATFTGPKIIPPTTATDIPLPPPPTPRDKHTHTPPIPGPTLMPQPTDPPLQPPIPTTAASSSTGEGTGPVGTSGPQPTTEPKPLFSSKGPVARGRPGDWVSPIDYPAQDLREGNQGTVRFRLDVNAAGRVTNCTVTASSGFPRLDTAACAKLSARARFDPASDEHGAKVAGVFTSAVRWTIPGD